MRNEILFTALSAIFITIFTMGESYAQSRNFQEPHVRGVRLDLCKHQGGKGCGKPAADLFCKEMNYSRSIGHKVDPRTGERLGRTLIFGDGALCNGYTCRAFASILCLKDEIVKTPVPKKPKPPKKLEPVPEKNAEKKPVSKKPENPKKKSETAKLPPRKPAPPKSVAVPTPRPKAETVDIDAAEPQDNFVLLLPKARKVLPGGALLTNCFGNVETCQFPSTYGYLGVETNNPPGIKVFQWSVVDVPEAKLAVWQVSTKPFPAFANTEADMQFDGLIKWSTIGNPPHNKGILRVPFLDILKDAQLNPVPEKLYLRIIPMSGLVGGTPVGTPSNIMVVHVDTETPPPPEIDLSHMQEHLESLVEEPLFSVRIKSFQPPEFDKGNKWGCVVVIDHPERWKAPDLGFGSSNELWRDHFPIGAELCPKPYRGDSGKITSFDDFVDFVFNAWDWVGDRYDDLIDVAVKVALYGSGLGLQCQLIADISNESAVEDVCETGARVAVGAGMVALGMPPSIPSFNELVDEGVDYAVELAIEEFESQTGVPCLGPCEDALRAGFEAAAEEIKRQPDRTACVDPTEAHKHGREPMCLPPDLIVRPAPGSVYVPPNATIEITRRTDVELPWGRKHPDCYAFARMEFANFYQGGTVYGKTTQQSVEVNPQSISGKLYGAWNRELKLNTPLGETITATVVFDEALKHQFPWTKKLWQTSQAIQRDELGPFGPDWFALFLESQMTMTAGSNCADESAQLQMTMPKW